MTLNDLFTFSGDSLYWQEVETKAGKEYLIKGFASTTDPDLVDDIVSEKALDSIVEQSKERIIKLDFEHETFRGDTEVAKRLNISKSPLGKARTAYRKDNGVMFEWTLNPDWVSRDSEGRVTKTFEQVWNEVKGGFLDQFSITFRPVKTAMKQVGKKTMRILEELQLYNVALTGTAINPMARMASIMAKSLDYMTEQENSHSPSLQKASTGATGGGNHMTDNKENFEVKDSSVIEELKSKVESMEQELKDIKESTPSEEQKGAEEKAQASEAEAKSLAELKSQLEIEVKAKEEAKAALKALEAQHEELKAEKAKQEEILASPAVKGFIEQREVEANHESKAAKEESKAQGPMDFI